MTHHIVRSCVIPLIVAVCATWLAHGAHAESQLVPVGESNDRILTWDSPDDKGGAQRMYSYSIDGQPYSRSLSASGIVRLKFAEFDPRNGEPAIEASLGAEATAGANQTHRLFIVQFIIPPLQSMLDELRDVGATPLIYLPDECEIVRHRLRSSRLCAGWVRFTLRTSSILHFARSSATIWPPRRQAPIRL